MTTRALVLGAGACRNAWETGVLAGLANAGTDVGNADLLVGTSAGAVVAAQVSSGIPVEELFQRQVDPKLQVEELRASPLEFSRLKDGIARAKAGGGSSCDILRRVGALALTARTVTERERRAVTEARLPVHRWPAARMRVVAVDTESGERRAFDRDDGVGLVDAVAASSAVPGVWPPVTIGQRRYTDGGVYSADSADLAAGCDRVLILSLPPRVPLLPWCRLKPQLTGCGAQAPAWRSSGRTRPPSWCSPQQAEICSTPRFVKEARAGREQDLGPVADRVALLWR